MARESKVIVVTGANRGIGLEIARQLARTSARVVLTARHPDAGQEALAKLKSEGLTAEFQPLEVTEEKSIQRLVDHLSHAYGHLDVLINNAGIIDDADADVLELPLTAATNTLETNTLAPLRLAQATAGLLRRSKAGRIINISSGMGSLDGMGPDHAAYRISKAALNAVTVMLSDALPKIAVNSVCPGWVRTDMGGPNAERDVAQGADTPVWLALTAPQSLTGKLVRDRKVVPW